MLPGSARGKIGENGGRSNARPAAYISCDDDHLRILIQYCLRCFMKVSFHGLPDFQPERNDREAPKTIIVLCLTFDIA
jgi:hypothetical protein